MDRLSRTVSLRFAISSELMKDGTPDFDGLSEVITNFLEENDFEFVGLDY